MTEKRTTNRKFGPQAIRKTATLLGLTKEQITATLSQRRFLEALSNEDRPKETRTFLRIAPNPTCRRSAIEKCERRLQNTNGRVRNAAQAREALVNSIGLPDAEIDAFVTCLHYCKTAKDCLKLLGVIPRGTWHECALLEKVRALHRAAQIKTNADATFALEQVIHHGPWSRATCSMALAQREIDDIAETDLRKSDTCAACIAIWERTSAPSPRVRRKILEKALSLSSGTADLKQIFRCCRSDGDHGITHEVMMESLEQCSK